MDQSTLHITPYWKGENDWKELIRAVAVVGCLTAAGI